VGEGEIQAKSEKLCETGTGQEKIKLRKKLEQILRSLYKLLVKMRKDCLTTA
jgi:hypothetical protein